MNIIKLTAETQNNLLDNLLKRSPNNYGQYESVVADIIANIRERKDQAVFEYTKKFDKWDITADNIKVTEEEIEEAYSKTDSDFIEVMKRCAANIDAFHRRQLRNSWIDTKPDGSILGQRIMPIAIS
ncbi:MAG: histidinol dehydrogenase, partial [Lachnospiraceae bacterium]|nr:histidinol dehydrogenase [Lachnospiraceae bacterium]